jgi:hypothetical protein
MKVICIDSNNKPKKVPDNEWIIEGETYTVTRIIRMGLQPDTYGFLLKEVQLSSSSFPYEYYSADRFLPIDMIISMEKEKVSEELDLELI